MSRTYRKKNKTVEYEPYLRKGKTLIRWLHRYFGDKSSGVRNAPKRFRKALERSRDAQDKQSLYRALVTGDDLLLPPRKHNANWEWW